MLFGCFGEITERQVGLVDWLMVWSSGYVGSKCSEDGEFLNL